MKSDKKYKTSNQPEDVTHLRYGFVHKSEDDKLMENIFRSDREKLHLFIMMLRRNELLKKAVIVHKPE